jgi:hypothetical protein
VQQEEAQQRFRRRNAALAFDCARLFSLLLPALGKQGGQNEPIFFSSIHHVPIIQEWKLLFQCLG